MIAICSSILQECHELDTMQRYPCAAHLPGDAEEKCEEAFFHLVYVMKWHNIPLKMILPMSHFESWILQKAQLNFKFNQIGNYILPSSSCTFHDWEAEQVNVAVKDEKCAYTLLVTITADGDFPPFQQVWSGATACSTPSLTAPHMQEAIDCGFNFMFAKSDKKMCHYSTLNTMKEVSYLIIFHFIRLIPHSSWLSGFRTYWCSRDRVLLKQIPIWTAIQFMQVRVPGPTFGINTSILCTCQLYIHFLCKTSSTKFNFWYLCQVLGKHNLLMSD